LNLSPKYKQFIQEHVQRFLDFARNDKQYVVTFLTLLAIGSRFPDPRSGTDS